MNYQSSNLAQLVYSSGADMKIVGSMAARFQNQTDKVDERKRYGLLRIKDSRYLLNKSPKRTLLTPFSINLVLIEAISFP